MVRHGSEPVSLQGWAVVEMFGHSREVGYVTTEYFDAPFRRGSGIAGATKSSSFVRCGTKWLEREQDCVEP